MKNKVIAFCFIIAAIPAGGQVKYELGDAIAVGLKNNYSIIIARNRQSVTENNFTKGNAGMLPVIDFSGRYSGTINTTEQRLSAGGENITRGVHNTSANGGVALSWSLFRGFSAQTTYMKLAELKEIGELGTQIAIENLIARIVAEYNFYIQQKRLYSNLEFALALSRERVRIDEERYLIGDGSKLQLLQSKVYFNSDSSRLARQNEVLRSSEIRLNELMALGDLGQRTDVADSLLTIDATLNFGDLLDETLEFNTSLIVARKNQTVSQYDYKVISSRVYPYLTLTSGYNATLSMFESGTYTSQLTTGANYGLTFGVNLFDGFNNRNDRRNALLDIENRDLQYRQIEQEVKADLLIIYSGYENNLRLLRLEEENLKTASENLEIAFERYKLGDLSGLDLREVQKSLLDAEERLLSVQYQTKSAEISLLQISGRVMEYVR